LLELRNGLRNLKKKIQADEKYKDAAKTWEGSVVLVFKADPEAGFENEVLFYGSVAW